MAAAANDPVSWTAARARRWANPDRLLIAAAWTVIGLSALQILCFAFGRDQGIYAMVGQGILDGRMPYRDVWDFKPPGIFAVFAIAELLFGHAMSSIRIVELGAWLILTGAFIRIGREVFGSGVVGLTGAALAFLIQAQLEFWHTAQPESFGAVLTAVGLARAVRTRRCISEGAGRSLGGLIELGVWFGLAFLFKPPLGGGAVVCAAYLARARYDVTGRVTAAAATVFTIGVASLLPIALCSAWLWAGGAWPAFSWTSFEFTPGYTSLGWRGDPLPLFYFGVQEAFVGFSAVAPAGILAALIWQPIHSREREGIFLLLGVIALHLTGIAMQAKFFQYHFGATLPLIALLGGLGIYKMYRRMSRWGPIGQAALALLLVLLGSLQTAVRTNPGTFWQRSADRLRFLAGMGLDRQALDEKLYQVADYDFGADRRASARIQQLTTSTSTVFIWGFEPVIYWLADRPTASRYIYNVPQRTPWQRERARRELLADLAARPPAVFVVEHGDIFEYVTGDYLDSARSLATFPELAELLDESYELQTTVDQFDLYVRRSEPQPPRPLGRGDAFQQPTDDG